MSSNFQVPYYGDRSRRRTNQVKKPDSLVEAYGVCHTVVFKLMIVSVELAKLGLYSDTTVCGKSWLI